MYTIIRNDYIRAKGRKTYRVDIVCDTEADLPEARPTWAQGSTAWIINGAALKVLDSTGKWVGK